MISLILSVDVILALTCPYLNDLLCILYKFVFFFFASSTISLSNLLMLSVHILCSTYMNQLNQSYVVKVHKLFT